MSLKGNGKIKILAYSDMACATGFGTVSRNIYEALYKTGKYDFQIFGINYFGSPHDFPYRIWPAGFGDPKNDPYGRQKFCGMIQNMEFDLLFFLQDTFILDFLPELIPFLQSKGKKFKSVVYYPVDGEPKPQWIKNVSFCDYKVAYSEFGKRESLKVFPGIGDLDVIPHGANIKDFHPLDKATIDDFKKHYFRKHADKYIVTNLNRNQPRKDMPRTIAAFKEFKKTVPNAILYMHCSKIDQGWDLVEVCRAYGLSVADDVIFPENFGPNQGYPIPVVNLVYNASDLVVSTTLGEGAGLSWLEAMATKTPVLMPNNTALTEFITEDKGYLIDSGTNPNLQTVLSRDNEVIRPLVDIDDMVKKMIHIYNNPEEAKRKAEVAYNWITTKMDWQGPIAKQWVALFDKAYEDLQKTNAVADKTSLIKTEVL